MKYRLFIKGTLKKCNNENETIGILYLNEKKICFMLEDEKREIKVMGETRIPAGTYKILLRKAGRLHEKYKNKFPYMHKGMLHLQDVPNFTYIYLHIGTKDEDTLGCPLTGSKLKIVNDDLFTEGSTIAYKKMYKKVVDEAEAENLYIQIIDN